MQPDGDGAVRTCQRCGATFERVRSGGRPPKYCSVDCRTKANNSRPNARVAGDRSWPRDTQIEREVCEKYQSGLSTWSVADTYGVSEGTVERVLNRNGIARRDRNMSTVRKRFKGGRITHASGYIWLRIDDDDPLACMRSPNGYAQEHRIVMARHLGRPLDKTETVHHKNAQRADNRLENLELWVGRHGTGGRVEDLVAFVIEHYPDAARAALNGEPQELWLAPRVLTD
jgi:HNH endonuclease